MKRKQKNLQAFSTGLTIMQILSLFVKKSAEPVYQ